MSKETKFSKFWFKVKEPDGSLFSAAFLDNEMFDRIYEEEAREALGDYRHFTVNTTAGKMYPDKLAKAIATFQEKTGVHPREFLAGRFQTERIESLENLLEKD